MAVESKHMVLAAIAPGKTRIELRRELTTAQKARNYFDRSPRPEDTKYPGWPRMLKTVVPRGEIFSRDFNAAYISRWTLSN